MTHILLLIAVSLFFRFLYLGVIPVSLSHDETDLIIQAHSVIHTGQDIAGTWQPLDLLPNSGVMAELAPIINLPALSILPNSLFSAHFTTALLSVFFPLLIYYWLNLLKLGKGVSLISAWLLVISPWHILFSRTTLEQPASLFFYLLAWIFLTKIAQGINNRYHQIFALLLFVVTYALGFFTYHGYKFSLPLMTIYYLIWLVLPKDNRCFARRLVIPALFILFLLVRTYFYSDRYASRADELIFFNTSQIAEQVNSDRRLSLAPDSLKNLLSNKPLKVAQVIKDKYVGVMNPEMLFLKGEANGVFSIWQFGYLYLITLPFLLIGLGHLILKHDKNHLLLLGFLLLSPLASVIHVKETLAFKSALYYVFLNIITAYGFSLFWNQLKTSSQRVKLVFTVALGLSLLYSVIYFSNIYFYVSPITNANSYFFSDRVVANYVRLSQGERIFILTKQPRYTLASIILTNRKITPDLISSFAGQYSPSDSDYYNSATLTITSDCLHYEPTPHDTVIIAKSHAYDLQRCPALSHRLTMADHDRRASIVSPKDSGEEYQIYDDQTCQTSQLRSYVHPRSLADYRLESLDQSLFCEKWIVRQ